MGITVLVVDVTVSLAAGASSVVTPGLPFSAESILPDRATPIYVSAFTSTTVTFTNGNSAGTETANFRIYTWHTIEANTDLGRQFWQGGNSPNIGATAAIRQTVAQSIPGTTLTQITYDSTDFATPSSFADLTNNQLVAPVAGLYQIYASVRFAANALAAGTTLVGSTININGTQAEGTVAQIFTETQSSSALVSLVAALSAGDTVTAVVIQGTTATAADTDVSSAARQAKLQAFLIG
jgi:hypothetical protein